MTEKCELSTNKKAEQGEIHCPVALLVFRPSCPSCDCSRRLLLPSAEDRDRIHISCPNQPQGLLPVRECQLSTVRGCWRSPGSLRKPQSLSTSQLFCRSLVLVLLLLQLFTSAGFALCVSGGLGCILRMYFNWSFQTSSG